MRFSAGFMRMMGWDVMKSSSLCLQLRFYFPILIVLDKLHQFSSPGLPASAQSSYNPSSLRAWSRFVLHQSSLYQMRERGRATGEFALCSIRPDLITGLPDYNDTPLNSRNCHCVSGAHRWISLLHNFFYACHSKRGRLSSLGRAKGNWPSIPDEREWPSTRVMIGNVWVSPMRSLPEGGLSRNGTKKSFV